MYTPLALLCLLVACDGGFDAPDAAVRALIQRTERGDTDGARACLCADERATDVTFTLQPGTTYRVDPTFRDGMHTIVPVLFVHGGEEETMGFVVVEDGGHYVSLTTTLSRHMTLRVQAEVEALGPNPSPEDLTRAMQRGMAAPAGR